MSLKSYIFKRKAKGLAKFAARTEAKILMGSLFTIGTHKMIQKAAHKYPVLNFLKVDKNEL
jgi:hypothetical protein